MTATRTFGLLSVLALIPSAALAADPFDALGSAGDYTLLGMADYGSGTSAGFVQLGSAAHVYGDVGARWRIETASGVVVEGDSHYGTGGSLHGGTVRGTDSQLSEADWATVQADAHAAIEAAFDLDATVLSGAPAASCAGTATSSGSVGSHHLVANRDDEGLSVYEFDGCLYLADGDTLTIEGTEDDRFVIRVTGAFRMDEGAEVVLDGVPGSAVMFAFDSGGWSSDPWAQVTVWDGSASSGASLSGVIVAPWMYWQLGDGTLLPDTRLLVGGTQANIQDLHSTGPITGSPLEAEPDEDHPEDDEGDGDDEDNSGDDHPDCDRPIWGSGIICPSDRLESITEADSSGPADESDRNAPGGSEDSDHGAEAIEVDESASGRGHDKGSAGCVTVGWDAGLLAACMGLFAAGTRRRRD